MADVIVVRADLPAQVEELIVLVGRERLIGAREWDLTRGPNGLTLLVDGVPVVFEDGSDGSWVRAALPSRTVRAADRDESFTGP